MNYTDGLYPMLVIATVLCLFAVWPAEVMFMTMFIAIFGVIGLLAEYVEHNQVAVAPQIQSYADNKSFFTNEFNKAQKNDQILQ